MTKQELINQIKLKQSFLCVGLDTDLTKIPTHLLKEKDPIFEFNKQIIDATHDLCVAYKPNLAFYEVYGSQGWESLQKTIEYIPKEIFKAKENGKKILIALGFPPPDYWFESYISIELSWSSHINFLEDVIRLSQNLNDTFVILRYKSIEWTNNTHFKKILKKIDDCDNIIISTNYVESFYSYKLCANADLIIAKHTSLADECLSHSIPVLFYEYGHNHTKIISDVFNYLSSELMCHNFEELLEKSKSLLFNSSSKLKDEINRLNKTIYHVKEKGNIKNKIIGNLENLLNSTLRHTI